MAIRIYPLMSGVMLLFLASVTLSHDNHCFTRSSGITRESRYCQGMTIPAYKTRNFISEQLRCSGGSHNYTRTPVPFDEETWRDTLNSNPAAASAILRNLPVPQWEGSVDFRSNLHWSWEDCQLITSASRCGTKEVCETVDTGESKGEQKGSKNRKKQHCHREPKTCYADVVVHESAFCSKEKIDYDVQFIPIDENDESYPDRLKNGFDLLPGEHEQIAVSNGVWLMDAAVMAPQLSFQEPRNKYQVSRKLTAGYDRSHLECQQGKTYRVGFTVLPIERIRSRSGNGFSLPVSFDGESIELLLWQSARDADGVRQDKGYPVAMRVQDYSAVAMSEFSQDTGTIFRSLVVRVQLYDQSMFALPLARSTIYIEEGKGVAQSLNAWSEKQDIRRSHLWELMLETNSIDPNKNLYRNFIPWFVYYPARLFFAPQRLSYENQLSPGTTYQLSLTVYQKNSGIYFQACEDEPEAWDCQYYAGSGWLSPSRYERGYYSDKSLDVTFTSPENINLRSWWPVFWSTVSLLDDFAAIGMVTFVVMRASSNAPKGGG